MNWTSKSDLVLNKDGNVIAITQDRLPSDREANAAHIVKCVNLHDELVLMLNELRNRQGITKLCNLDELDQINDLLKRAKGEV